MFCGLIYFPLVNMNCLCITTVKYPLWNSGKTGSIILFLSICKLGMCDFFSCYLDMAIVFFFNCCENPYMKREGLNYLWVPCVSWGFYVEKMTSVPNYFQRGESAFYVVPSEKIMFCFFIYLRDSCHLLVHSLNAHNDPILEPNLGAQSKPPTWVAGTQTLEPSQLLPKVHRSRKLELEKRVRLWTQALWYGTRGSKMAPYQLGQTPTPR